MPMNIYETTVHVLGENNELSIVKLIWFQWNEILNKFQKNWVRKLGRKFIHL